MRRSIEAACFQAFSSYQAPALNGFPSVLRSRWLILLLRVPSTSTGGRIDQTSHDQTSRRPSLPTLLRFPIVEGFSERSEYAPGLRMFPPAHSLCKSDIATLLPGGITAR